MFEMNKHQMIYGIRNGQQVASLMATTTYSEIQEGVFEEIEETENEELSGKAPD